MIFFDIYIISERIYSIFFETVYSNSFSDILKETADKVYDTFLNAPIHRTYHTVLTELSPHYVTHTEELFALLSSQLVMVPVRYTYLYIFILTCTYVSNNSVFVLSRFLNTNIIRSKIVYNKY